MSFIWGFQYFVATFKLEEISNNTATSKYWKAYIHKFITNSILKKDIAG